MTAKELLKKYKTGQKINFIDIRGKEKYDYCHFPEAKLIDRKDLLSEPSEFLKNNEKYYISCNGGNSASVIAHTLKAQGFDIESVEEGMNPFVREYAKK